MSLNGTIRPLSSLPSSKGRILSIQSHVAYGYVGGKAAVFPLQCLSYDVDIVNTVNFSNHSGYGRFGGDRTTGDDLARIFELMEQNGLLFCERLLTGYVPSAEALSAVANLASKLRARNPDLTYLLDPVLGDSGRLYVSPDCVPVYRSILPLATVITPNWFEAEVLTDIKLTDIGSLRQMLKKLHQEYRVPNVVISSLPLRPWLLEALPAHLRPPFSTQAQDPSEFILCLSSSATDNADLISTVHVRCVPCIPGYFSGVGDLFSALVLAHYQEPGVTLSSSETTLSRAVSMALSKTHSLILLTDEYAASLPQEERLPTDDERDSADPMRKIRRMRGRELRLIQGQDVIRETTVKSAMQDWDNFWTTK